MLSLVASAGIAMGFLPPAAVNKAWDLLRPSLVTIGTGPGAGYAVSIDSRGYYLCHTSILTTGAIMGKLSDGRIVSLQTSFIDEATQLALLTSITPELNSGAPSVPIAEPGTLAGKGIIAVTTAGPIAGECVAVDRMGVMKPTQRYVPLAEIQFETPGNRLAGALVFTETGHLAGALSATLEPLANMRMEQSKSMDSARSYGPSGLTVGYMLSGDILTRVVAGFRSPGHQPKHPSVGMLFRDAKGAGAEVVGFGAASTAKEAGLQVGDVIIDVDGAPVSSAFSLARILFGKPVGKSIRVSFRRGDDTTTRVITVPVGVYAPTSDSLRAKSM